MRINILLLLLLTLASSCTISYKLNGASIDYTTTKTISFEAFPIKAPLVYAPLAVNFNDELTGKFASQTRLEQVRQDGDLQISQGRCLCSTDPPHYQGQGQVRQQEESIGGFRAGVFSLPRLRRNTPADRCPGRTV